MIAIARAATDEAYRAYQAAVLDGSRRRAVEAVDQAVAAGLDLRTIYLDVFQQRSARSVASGS